MQNVEHALMYLGAGASVIPVGSDKKPLIEWRAYQKRHPYLREVAAWYRRWPCAGVAIICGAVSRVCVLDVEQEAIPELLDLAVPDTLTARTQRDGLHFYFKYDETLRSTTWSVDGRHCGELRSDGNYVLAPPSLGPVGQYCWLRGPGSIELAEPPSWVHELSRTRGRKNVVRSAVPTVPSRSEEDQRQALAMVLAGRTTAEIHSFLLVQPAAQDRSNAQDYCARTERRARGFAEAHYANAQIVRVVTSKDGVSLSFKVLSGSHAGRTLRRVLDLPMTERSTPVWSSLVALLGRPMRNPVELLGLEVRIGVFERGAGLAVGGLAHPPGKDRSSSAFDERRG